MERNEMRQNDVKKPGVKKPEKKRKIYKLTIFFIIVDIFVALCFIVVYFIPSIKTTIINTAYGTMTHKYLAYIFYSEKTVDKVRSENYIIPINEDVDLNQIVIDTSEKQHYDTVEDEQILKRDPNNPDYKIINIDHIGNSHGYLVAIYDPSRVHLLAKEKFATPSKLGERMLDMCNRYNGLVCINGGGFLEEDGWGVDKPIGSVVKDGEIIWSSGYNPRANLIAMTWDNKLLLTVNSAENAVANENVRDALEFGPFLIVNGTPMTSVGDGGYGKSPRVAIAQRKDGIILFLVVDGSALYIDGATLTDVIEVLQRYGAWNAANLDGGNSSTLIVEGKTYNTLMPNAARTGGRYVVDGWGLLPK